MLLIGDIHINAKMKERIVAKLRDFVDQHPQEQSIVFLGDYVYHFAYDRASLLMLFSFFGDLYQAGKQVYVLAGNHDWIAEQFCFEEGKLAFEMMKVESLKIKGERSKEQGESVEALLKFITNVEEVEIEGESVLFLPYNVHLAQGDHRLVGVKRDKEEGMERWGEIVDSINKTGDQRDRLLVIYEKSQLLLSSENKREQSSGMVNMLLLERVVNFLQRDSDLVTGMTSGEVLTVMHHYYIEGVEFPGERGRYGFKDVALCCEWLDIPFLRFISGHLHKPFVSHNYLCVGSVWATSPLESNQIKIVCVYRGGCVDMNPFWVNGYVHCHGQGRDGLLNTSFFEQLFDALWVDCQTNLQVRYKDLIRETLFDISFGDMKMPDLHLMTLVLLVDQLDYTQIGNYLDESVMNDFDHVRLKKQGTNLDDLMGKLDISSKNLRDGFHDWKGILKEYILMKYPEDAEAYFDELRGLKLL